MATSDAEVDKGGKSAASLKGDRQAINSPSTLDLRPDEKNRVDSIAGIKWA
jgi:hypothetical protein